MSQVGRGVILFQKVPKFRLGVGGVNPFLTKSQVQESPKKGMGQGGGGHMVIFPSFADFLF